MGYTNREISERTKLKRNITKLKSRCEELEAQMAETTDFTTFEKIRRKCDSLYIQIESEQNIYDRVWQSFRNKKDNIEVVL